MKLIQKIVVLFCIILSCSLKAQENQGSSVGAVKSSNNSTDVVMLPKFGVVGLKDQLDCMIITSDSVVTENSKFVAVLIRTVKSKSSAEQAGIKPGMQLIAVGGQRFTSRNLSIGLIKDRLQEATKVEVTPTDRLRGWIDMKITVNDPQFKAAQKTVTIRVKLMDSDSGTVVAAAN